MKDIKEKILSIHEDLVKAVSKLEEALTLKEDEIHKDASIQRFEFSFELAWKLMQSMAGFHGKEARSPRESIHTNPLLFVGKFCHSFAIYYFNSKLVRLPC
mgnify:CR=1 FL=1